MNRIYPRFNTAALLSTYILNIIMVSFVACLLVSATPAKAAGATISEDFTVAWKQFHALAKDSKRSKYRANWVKIGKKFIRTFKRSPRGSYAPKSLYYAGRTYEELGTHSGLKKDFRTAIDYYGRMISNFPRHSWTDDCLFLRAELQRTRLGNNDLAYSDYLTIVHKYPKGDMYKKARNRLDSMDRKDIPKSSAKANRPSGTVVSSKSPKNQKRSGTTTRLQAVRYTSSESYTRVVLDMDEQTPYRYQLLNPNQNANRPHRLYIDLEDTRLGPDVHKKIVIADGILRGIRSAQKDPRTTRVVLDFNSMQEYKIFPLENPFRLVVDVQANEESKSDIPIEEDAVYNKKAHSKPKKYTPPKGSKKMAGELLEQLGLTFRTIMIDAGHGGKDPGAHGHGLREKDVNLHFAKMLAGKLKKAGFRVLYTRDTDVFIPLEERTAMANVKKADMFISVHCNAHRNSRIHGLETYTLNLASNRNAVRVAARENAVSMKRISDLQVILTDLMLNSKMKESRDLATDIHKSALSKLRRRWNVNDQGVREAPFYVLMGAKMPSILIELGYLTNKTEASRLKSDSYLSSIADGIVKGVLQYKKEIERYANL